MPSRNFLFRRALHVLVASAALCCAPAWAGPKNVPFKATVTAQEMLRPDPSRCVAPPYLVGTTTGTGVASHLGAITYVATDCVTPNPSSFTFSDGRLTITAANGDELRASYSGTLLPIPNTAPYTLFTISGTFSVTGGTGRFNGASGSGYLQGSENIQTGQGQIDLIGTLSY